jgi:hypothetical protein
MVLLSCLYGHLLQGIQKNMQQFEMCATMEWLERKERGSTTGCRNVRSLQPSKQHALCKIVNSIEEHVFVKSFYQTCSFVTVQRQLWRKFNRWQSPVRFGISHLAQKFDGSVCDDKKGVVGRYRSTCIKDTVVCVHKVLLWSPRKSVT